MLRILTALALLPVSAAAAPLDWLPPDLPPAPADGPALCPGAFLTPAQGRAVLDAALKQFPDRASWEACASHLRGSIQSGLNLSPWPRRTPLDPVIRDRRVHDGYSVENVAFESVPGCFVTGNLYRPLRAEGACAVVLSTHGHTPVPATDGEYGRHGRFTDAMQLRCAALARMGAIVLSIDMFAHGDGIAIYGAAAHRQPIALTIQTWNAMRALDFLLSLEGADPRRVAVSGESGGGTQSFLLAALDARVTLSVPVVMVSAHFFGGCPCESSLPIHRSPGHFASNAMIAALAAPRPQLVVSDGKDWTLNVPEVEYPFLRRIYGYFGVERQVANVHLADEGHDYGPSKRAAMYRFVASRFGLDLAAVLTPAGDIDESRGRVESPATMRFFNEANPVPDRALRAGAAVDEAVRRQQRPE